MEIYSETLAKLEEFGSDPLKGLTTEQVRINREKYGSNQLSEREKDPLWKQYLEKFQDPTIIILMSAAGLAFISGCYKGITTGDWLGIVEALAILVAVFLATGVGFWLELKADQSFELLRKEAENLVVMITRDGNFQTIKVNDLVVGDIVHLEPGKKIPADGLVLHTATGLSVNQSIWNGEPKPARKADTPAEIDKDHPEHERRNFLIGMTLVTEGQATMLITAVGDRSERGKIAKELSSIEEEETPLTQKLNKLAELINIGGTAIAALIFSSVLGAGIMRGDLGGVIQPVGQTVLMIAMPLITLAVLLYIFGTQKGRENPVRPIIYGWAAVLLAGLVIVFVWGTPMIGAGVFNSLLTNVFDPVLKYFMLAVTIIVVAVPEGLPMAITISLALSAANIRKDNNLIRKQIATETLGSTNVICSDKTGTLTLNRMSVDRIYVHGQVYNRDGRDMQSLNLSGHPAFEKMKLISARNSTAHLEEKLGELEFVGNHTEGALLKWLYDQNINYHDIRDNVPLVELLEFSPDRKMMSTVIFDNGQPLVLSKGAPFRILELCELIEVGDREVEPIDKWRSKLEKQLDEMCNQAMRPLALAYRYCDEGVSKDGYEKRLTLLAIVGITDPARPDAPEAIAICKRAGVDVKVVTGDNEKTASVIASQLGILENDSIVLGGDKFDAMSDEEILSIASRLKILARATPLQKKRLVELLQSLGNVVAVTGDGTNDAPALKKADVGISMGLRGTDIAKEASDIVLTDDNFGSIVRAIHWGRALYENVQKFLQFQLTINLSALAIAFLSPLLALGLVFLADRGLHFLPNANFQELPLTILQLLWVNLIMDTLAALAFSLEPKREELMKEPPKRRDESFITRSMAENILVMGIYFTLVILFIQATGWYLGIQLSPNTELQAKQVSSVLFATYVFMQVFNMFNARSVRPDRSAFAGVLKSKNFLMVMSGIVIVQVLLIQYGGEAFHTSPLPLNIWINVILVGVSSLLFGEVYRFFRRRGMQQKRVSVH